MSSEGRARGGYALEVWFDRPLRGMQVGMQRCFMSYDLSVPAKHPRILLAEDDHEMRSLIAWTLHRAGYKVTECRSGFELFQHLRASLEYSKSKGYDLLVSDIRLPGFNAFEVLEDMQSQGECPPIILITSFGDDATHKRAKQMGVAAMFDKPFDMDDLTKMVRELVPNGERRLEENQDSEDVSALDPHPD